jgi:hypothetical protein
VTKSEQCKIYRNQIAIKRKIKKVNSGELNYLLDISGHSDFAFFLEINHKGVFSFVMSEVSYFFF